MKIAWFTPFSRGSAIGQCSAIIVQELARHAEVVVFVSDTQAPGETWLPDFPQRAIQAESLPDLLASLNAFDIAIYNLGDNCPLHCAIYRVSIRHPGIVILHDLVMHHFFTGYYFLEEKNPAAYVEALAFAHGQSGRELGQQVIAGSVGPLWETSVMLDYHMAAAALAGCYGVVTHSRFTLNAIEKFAAYPAAHIDFPALDVRPAAPRLKEDGKIRLLSFGMLNRNKMIDRVISAIGQSAILRDRVIYNVIGAGEPDVMGELEGLVSRFDLSGTVHLLGRLSHEVLYAYMDEADVVVNLRNPHYGESSWVLLETAFAAKPTVVWKHGYYDEFPDDAVAKVTDENLVATLETLATNADLRRGLSERIERYAHATFNTERYCRQLLDFIRTARYNAPLLRLADDMAGKVAEVSAGDRGLTQLVAAEIAHLITSTST